ncbi:MAG TPA: cutinase family protein [Mycobacterium sp.]|nr:cutinase family protein [Mycobacterium sp.]
MSPKGANPVRSILAVVAITCAGLLGAPVPSASAQQCPDVEVVFARGTGEPAGVGGVGQAFVDSLRSQVGSKSVNVYGVNYQASGDFTSPDFAKTVVDGVRDESNHVQSMAATCPNTKTVLGGYSQGAVVTGYVTAAAVPPGVPASQVPAPMPPEVANHIAAVALFGEPSAAFLQSYGAPPIVLGPLYAAKTIDLCAPGDTICNGAPNGAPTPAHIMYAVDGMVGQAAAYAASRL